MLHYTMPWQEVLEEWRSLVHAARMTRFMRYQRHIIFRRQQLEDARSILHEEP